MRSDDEQRSHRPASPRAAAVRLLGAQRERRPGREQDRAAHRLGPRYNVELARLAENNGFDYALSQVRYMASYGAAYQHESTSFSLALAAGHRAAQGDRRRPPRPVAARACWPSWSRRADQITGGRVAVNVVSGWFKDEFTKLGEPWLEHGERYRRSEEFIRYLREIWTSDHAELQGDFYRLHDFDLKPKPVDRPRAGAPRDLHGRQLDRRPRHGWPGRGLVLHERQHPRGHRASRSATSPTWRPSTAGPCGSASTASSSAVTPRRRRATSSREIVDKADREAVEGFGSAVKQAGQSTGDKKGMWQDSEFADLVQYNDGFRTGLIGTPEQIADRMLEYKRAGVNLFLLGFLHFQEDVSTSAARCSRSSVSSRQRSWSGSDDGTLVRESLADRPRSRARRVRPSGRARPRRAVRRRCRRARRGPSGPAAELDELSRRPACSRSPCPGRTAAPTCRPRRWPRCSGCSRPGTRASRRSRTATSSTSTRCATRGRRHSRRSSSARCWPASGSATPSRRSAPSTSATSAPRCAPAAGRLVALDGEKGYSTGRAVRATGSRCSPTSTRTARCTWPGSSARAAGVTVVDDWDGMGQRTTASGTVRLDEVAGATGAGSRRTT